jgi:hypothetical protein
MAGRADVVGSVAADQPAATVEGAVGAFLGERLLTAGDRDVGMIPAGAALDPDADPSGAPSLRDDVLVIALFGGGH